MLYNVLYNKSCYIVVMIILKQYLLLKAVKYSTNLLWFKSIIYV